MSLVGVMHKLMIGVIEIFKRWALTEARGKDLGGMSCVLIGAPHLSVGANPKPLGEKIKERIEYCL